MQLMKISRAFKGFAGLAVLSSVLLAGCPYFSSSRNLGEVTAELNDANRQVTISGAKIEELEQQIEKSKAKYESEIIRVSKALEKKTGEYNVLTQNFDKQKKDFAKKTNQLDSVERDNLSYRACNSSLETRTVELREDMCKLRIDKSESEMRLLQSAFNLYDSLPETTQKRFQKRHPFYDFKDTRYALKLVDFLADELREAYKTPKK